MKEQIWIEWLDGEIFAVWCHRCSEVTELARSDDKLYCTKCTSKLAMKVDDDLVKLVREGRTIQ